jgi:hypothetical protein
MDPTNVDILTVWVYSAPWVGKVASEANLTEVLPSKKLIALLLPDELHTLVWKTLTSLANQRHTKS